MNEQLNEISLLEKAYPSSPELGQQILTRDASGLALSFVHHKVSGQFEPEWFLILANAGGFNLEHIPKTAKIISEGRELMTLPGWEACFTLTTASRWSLEHSNKIIRKTIHHIISAYIKLVNDQDNNPDRNYICDYYFGISILWLPLEEITGEHLNFIARYALAHNQSLMTADLTGRFFKRILESKSFSLATAVLDILFRPVRTDNFFKIDGAADDYYLKEFVDTNAVELEKVFGWKLVSWIYQKLKRISTENPSYFLRFNITSLEDDEQNQASDGLNISLVRLFTETFNLSSSKSAAQLVSTLLDSDNPIENRIGYFSIDKNYQRYKEFFWTATNPLKNQECKLEVFHLVNRHAGELMQGEIQILKKWIRNLRYDPDTEMDRNDQRMYAAYMKTEWFQALEPIFPKYPSLKNAFERLKKIAGGETKSHPGYDTFHTVFSAEVSSNITTTNMPVDELIKTLLAYDVSESGQFGSEIALSDYIVTNFSKLAEKPLAFKEVPIRYLYQLMDGLRNVAERKTEENWTGVINLISEYLKHHDRLWEPLDKEDRNISSGLGMCAWFLRSLCENDRTDLAIEQLEAIGKALIYMDDNYNFPYKALNNDPTFDVINSTRGKIYDAMIKLSLRYAKQSEQKLWMKSIKDQFSMRLQGKQRYFEFYWMAGMHTPPISYLDKRWLEEYHSELFSNDTFGDAAFSSYLLFSRQVYSDLFVLFHDEYLSRSERLNANNNVTHKFVSHITAAFFYNMPGSEELIDQLFQLGSDIQLGYVIKTINFERDLLQSEKLINLWQRLLNAIDSNQLSRPKSGELLRFPEHFQTWDDQVVSLYEQSLSFTKDNINSWGIVQMLSKKIATNRSGHAGQMFKALLENSSINFSIDDEKINGMLTDLYEQQHVAIADSVVLELIRRRRFEVIKIYNRHHGS